jgi:ABC-type protease/lipase transport system fused ATPase/permease subunit
MKDKYQYERGDLGQVRASLRHLFVTVGLFITLVNLLLLIGPLYMLHVYDRVLPSGAVQTLVAPINGVVHGLTISSAQAVAQPAKPILHLATNDQIPVIILK